MVVELLLVVVMSVLLINLHFLTTTIKGGRIKVGIVVGCGSAE